MSSRLITTCATAVAILAMTGCGGSSDGDSASDDGGSSGDSLVSLMVEQGAPQEEAECIADKLDGVSADDLTEFFESIDAGDDVVATEGVAEKFINAKAECTLVE